MNTEYNKTTFDDWYASRVYVENVANALPYAKKMGLDIAELNVPGWVWHDGPDGAIVSYVWRVADDTFCGPLWGGDYSPDMPLRDAAFDIWESRNEWILSGGWIVRGHDE